MKIADFSVEAVVPSEMSQCVLRDVLHVSALRFLSHPPNLLLVILIFNLNDVIFSKFVDCKIERLSNGSRTEQAH